MKRKAFNIYFPINSFNQEKQAVTMPLAVHMVCLDWRKQGDIRMPAFNKRVQGIDSLIAKSTKLIEKNHLF